MAKRSSKLTVRRGGRGGTHGRPSTRGATAPRAKSLIVPLTTQSGHGTQAEGVRSWRRGDKTRRSDKDKPAPIGDGAPEGGGIQAFQGTIGL
jgi:hypothetical protein